MRFQAVISYATHAMQQTHDLQRNQKKQNTQCMHEKNTMHAHAIDAILACIAWVASVALYTIAWKPNFKSIFCILTAAAMF